MKVGVEFQEPDKKKKIKRIIAREGLILIGYVIFVIIFATIFQNILPYEIWDRIGSLLLFGYPLFIIIRFILWALRTLRGG